MFDFITETWDSFRKTNVRHFLNQGVSLGLVVTSALIIWKTLIVFTGSESPIVVVLTGSMEPGFRRGDILFLNLGKEPLRNGEIVVYKLDGREIPIVHRIVKLHERRPSAVADATDDVRSVDIVTKGDANMFDDTMGIYPDNLMWLNQRHIMGRVVGFLPHVGYATIIMTDFPWVKFLLIGGLGLMVLTVKD